MLGPTHSRHTSELRGASFEALAWLRGGRPTARAALVPLAEAAATMGRTVDEVIALAEAGIVDAEFSSEREVLRVRPVRLV